MVDKDPTDTVEYRFRVLSKLIRILQGKQVIQLTGFLIVLKE